MQENMGDDYESIRAEVDLIMDRFFMKRIGLRFLLQHDIDGENVVPGVSGIIHNDVEVGSILRKSAQET